ncbi:MAG: hypothetical protein WD824_07585 [Cyclobacteriaceae bacterium]
MKKLISFTALVLIVTSCTFYDVEPRYDSRDKFVGYYDVEEYSETYNDITFYEMRISKSGYDREIYLHDFYGADIRVYATVSFNEIRIPFQIVDGYEIEGSGSLYRNELSLSYRVKDLYEDTVSDFCETTAWR